MQIPTVLVRIPGPTRDKLLTMRATTSWGHVYESLGAVVSRLVEAQSKSSSSSKSSSPGKKSGSPTRRGRRRGRAAARR